LARNLFVPSLRSAALGQDIPGVSSSKNVLELLDGLKIAASMDQDFPKEEGQTGVHVTELNTSASIF
jgi:hypothetical protein